MRILFISANRIGDAVLTTGLLSWLQTTYPEARFTVACGPVTQDLFRAVPRVDNLIILQKQKHHGHWIKLWKHCIGTRWDMIVDLRNSIVTRLLFAEKKYYKVARATGRHKIIEHGSIFGLNPPPLPKIWIDEPTQAKAHALVRDDLGPILALGPAANWGPKSWDIANFIEVAKRLIADSTLFTVIPAKDGIQTITNQTKLDPSFRRDDAKWNGMLMIVAAPHERAQVQPLIDAFPPEQIIDLIGHDLLTVAASLSKATLFIGNDSGLMHIAAAMGVPTVGLFGPSDERIYGPYGPHTLAVRTPETREQLFALQPYPGADTPLLMSTLTVDKVMEGVEALLSQLQTSPSYRADPK